MTMESFTDAHRPTEAFRDYLEGEIVHTYRRNRMFRRVRAAAVIIVSVAIGSTATLASAQVRTNTQRDSILEAAKADMLLASTRLDLARMQLAEEQRLVNVGARSGTSLAAAQVQLRELEAQIGTAKLNIEEIEASALPPRDELNAPLVKDRDFVKARLQLRAMVAQQRLEGAERAHADEERRVAVGATSALDGNGSTVTLYRARRDLAVLAERLRARKEFLEKGTPVEELARRIEIVEVQQEVAVAQQVLTYARLRLEMLDKQQKVGAATELDVLKALVEVKEAEITLQQLSRRLKQLKG
jgi:hypothetical protein